jgi:hypothetical protein
LGFVSSHSFLATQPFQTPSRFYPHSWEELWFCVNKNMGNEWKKHGKNHVAKSCCKIYGWWSFLFKEIVCSACQETKQRETNRLNSVGFHLCPSRIWAPHDV